MDIITDLLRIKIFREEKAELAMMRGRNQLVIANNKLDFARNALKIFCDESSRREREMYKGLCSRVVILKEINDVFLEMQLMKEKVSLLQGEVELAVGNRDAASKKFFDLREIYREAVRIREKFNEIKNTFDGEKLEKFQRYEEFEMEESISANYPRKHEISIFDSKFN